MGHNTVSVQKGQCVGAALDGTRSEGTLRKGWGWWGRSSTSHVRLWRKKWVEAASSFTDVPRSLILWKSFFVGLPEVDGDRCSSFRKRGSMIHVIELATNAWKTRPQC